MEYFECPRCQFSDKFKSTKLEQLEQPQEGAFTIHTWIKGNTIHREKRCPNCNKIFYTEEKIVSVDYFNQTTRKAVRKPIEIYIKEELWNKENE